MSQQWVTVPVRLRGVSMPLELDVRAFRKIAASLDRKELTLEEMKTRTGLSAPTIRKRYPRNASGRYPVSEVERVECAGARPQGETVNGEY